MSTQLQNFYKATLTRNWSATTGDFNVSVAPTVSSGYLVVSPNNSTLREIIYYTATGSNSYGPYVTVSTLGGRGVGGTSAQVHSIGESVRMNITAEHWQEMQDDITSIIAAGLPAGSEGDIIKYTGGAWVASSLSEDQIKTATVSLTAAEIKALNATPKELIAAPGAGKCIFVDEVIYSFTYGGTQYTNGSTINVIYAGGTAHILGNAVGNGLSTTAMNAAANYIRSVVGDNTTPEAAVDTAIQLKASSTEFATGNGTLKIFLKYRILTL